MSHKYNNLTTVEDVYYLANEMKMFIKCFYTWPELRNYLNKYKPKNIKIVFNIINKPNRTGHWIAIYIINNEVFIFTCFGIIYRPLNEMFYSLGYYKVYYILDCKQDLRSNSCGYYSLLFLKYFDKDKLNDSSYVYYHKLPSKKIITTFKFKPDYDINKYIKYQKIFLSINES